MNGLLERLGLRFDSEVSLMSDRCTFVERLKETVNLTDPGMFSDIEDLFSSKEYEYKGRVGTNSFHLRRRRRFFDPTSGLADVQGHMQERAGQLTIKMKFNGMRKMFIPYMLIVPAIYLFIVVVMISGGGSGGMSLPFGIIFILIHGGFMLGVPYFIMRRGARRLKHDLERELFFIANK